MTQPQPIRIFFSYAHEDDHWRDRLRKQLNPWELEGKIEGWSDRLIPPGGNWSQEIATKLQSADIVVLLVSGDFLGSSFCMKEELPRIEQRYQEEAITVIPVLLRPCPWVESRYNIWQGYPKDLVPVTSWQNQDAALYDVAQGILAAVERCRRAQAASRSQTVGTLSDAEIERRYLEGQRYAVQTVRAEGIAQQEGIFTTLLNEVFVPLALAPSSISPGLMSLDRLPCDLMRNRLPSEHLPSERLPSERLPSERLLNELQIWDFLAQAESEPVYRQLAILAWGGYGKTTLLKHVTLIYSTHQHSLYGVPHRIPVLLTLRKHRETLAQSPELRLPELIVHHHVPSLPGAADLKIPVDWVTNKLEHGQMLVMIDGFDEVSPVQRPLVAAWINQQMQRYPKTVFVVTSRPRAYKEQTEEILQLDTMLWVQEFETKQRRKFVQQWYLCQERYSNGGRSTPDVLAVAQEAAEELLAQIENQQDFQLRDLAKNPLLLNMILRFHRRYPGADLPKRRLKLYEEICRLQLKDRPGARKLETILNYCEAQKILQLLALEMMQEHLERLSRNDVLHRLSQYLQMQSENIAATEFLIQVEEVSELLVRREEDYEFAHLSFQEYLAATQIAQQHQEEMLYPYFAEGWWKQTILLYAAQVNPTKLIQTALERDALDLAVTLVQETTKRLDDDLKVLVEAGVQQAEAAQLAKTIQSVQDSRYRKLEELLSEQEWVKADKETYRLMITAVGKEEGQWFEAEELLNFPCDALQAIDGLWVQYSQGRFGFSVQKQIYVECGGKLDGNYDAQAYRKLGDRVGWRQNGNWMRYTNVSKNISLSSPQGFFPTGLWVWGCEVWSREFMFSSLAYRSVNCSTQQS
jgi:hypothetical protein